MSNLRNESGQVGGMEENVTPASPRDALLPNKGEPEKNPIPLKTALSSRADSILMKASSLTRRQNSQNISANRSQGNEIYLYQITNTN